MHPLFSRRWMIPLPVLFVLWFLLMLSGYRSLAADATPTITPTAETTVEPSARTEGTSSAVDVSFGSGSFDLPVSTIGLAALSTYRATLLLSFKGTQNGKPMAWSRTYVMLTNQEPATRQLTIDTAGKTPEQMIIMEVNGAHYERDEENTCIGTVIEKDNAFAERWEPAGFLTGVIGAEEAGNETVSGVASNHYMFDESAFGQTDIAQSKGDVWVAVDGGYIVQYMLVTQGTADYFGEGIEGTLTWDYKLSDINLPLTITLSEDCPAGMVDAPLLSDAADVLSKPGMMTYSTHITVPDSAAFYQKQLLELGWKPVTSRTITDTTALLEYSKDDQRMVVTISASNGSTTVNILLGFIPKAPTKPPTRTPIPTKTKIPTRTLIPT